MSNKNKEQAQKLHDNLLREFYSYRIQLGFTQQYMDSVSGVDKGLISKMENLHKAPLMLTVLRLLLIFGKTLAIVPLSNNDITQSN